MLIYQEKFISWVPCHDRFTVHDEKLFLYSDDKTDSILNTAYSVLLYVVFQCVSHVLSTGKQFSLNEQNWKELFRIAV